MSNTAYGNDSIYMLTGADRVRKRPGVIFGSDGLDGCEHSVFEILSNSIDEAREGYGDRIIVVKHLDSSISVEDFGRGCPVGWNEREKKFNWELVFCELYAGGKYANAEDGNYEYALGLNGLGSCATQYSSEYMDVHVRRDGYIHSLHFEKGEISSINGVEGLHSEPEDYMFTGTYIHWRPDIEVFKEIDIPSEHFKSMLKKQAVVNPGITFEFHDQSDEDDYEVSEYMYENGIVDYIKEVSGSSTITQPYYVEGEKVGRDRPEDPDYKLKISSVFCFTSDKNLLEYYHNSSWLEHGGSPDKAVRSSFVSAVDDYAKKSGKYKKGESRITFADIQDSLILITNCFSTQTSYENQTKKSITNKFIQDAMNDFFKEKLSVYFTEYPKEADRIVNQILINKRSRESAEKTKLSVKKKLSANVDITNRIEKFVNCRSKDSSKREIFICEGDSAAGSCKLARDAEFQGIMPVRGKILNCLKVGYDRIFASDIITDLLRVLGCGVQIQGRKTTKDITSFDINKLRWNKIIICTDADVDGYQIRTLILSMLYRLTPDLISYGKVFIAETPLYEIICKGKTYFAYTDKEKNDIVKSLGSSKIQINRSKGLGENDPDMMWTTTMSPATRKLIQVDMKDAEEASKVFDLLLGDNLAGRKEHIAENGSKYLDQLDVS